MTEAEQFAQLMGGENCHACGQCGKMSAKWTQEQSRDFREVKSIYACSPSCAWPQTHFALHLWRHTAAFQGWFKITRSREGHSYDGLERKAHYAFRRQP